GGLVPLLGPGGAPVSSEPRALTAGGRTIAGKIPIPGGIFQAARWTDASGWVGLGDLAGGDAMSQALGISADGSVIVGWGTGTAGLLAARWSGGGVTSLGDLPGGALQSAAALVSADGTIVVGTGTSAAGPELFVWRSATGMSGLGDLAGGAFSSEPFGMNDDASVIVGEATSGSGVEAFRWTSGAGMQGLGDLPDGDFHSIAFDVTRDGAVVVGTATTAVGAEAFVWDAARGMRRLQDVLIAQGDTAVAGWTLTEATGISGDGRVVIGNGVNPSGFHEGWVARLR
ncbi:MAG TPA: PEP-CTERM sorting domain-containing protein, partial [Candidatus Binatia bacterium]|nr:PEP-CTERM sorting domain-containing protein [Candidatus Binatia bacterium]